MKIRFYHWWVYWLFRRVWTPIFEAKPELAREYIRLFSLWLNEKDAGTEEGKNHHDQETKNGNQ
jgi:hypothetical protein